MSVRDKLIPYTLPEFNYGTIDDPEVERRARLAVVKIRELQRAAIVDIGRELIEMKELLPDGTFLKWLEASFGWSRRTAVNYMQVSAEFGDQWETVSHLAPSVLYKLASPSTRSDVRKAVLDLKPGQVVGVRGLQIAIDESKTIVVRRERRANRLKLAGEQAEPRARFEADAARNRVEYDRRHEAAMPAAERLRDMLGGHWPEACRILSDLDCRDRGHELEKLAQHYRTVEAARSFGPQLGVGTTATPASAIG